MSRKPNTKPGLTYADAGVSIEEGDSLVERLARRNPAIGGFSGAFPLKLKGIRKPVLLASTDGVGTKLLLAQQAGVLDTVGIDLVAMVVNDLVVCGAKPLFFLDYYATGKLTAEEGDSVLSGIQTGCEDAGIPLIGGETAEMPGLYKPGHFDLAGFGVGIADQKKVIDGSRIREGDAVIGIASSGVHSNGFSLVRAILNRRKVKLDATHQTLDATVAATLLRPTRIYVRTVARLLKAVRPTGMSHITGGGIEGNLCRGLPKGTAALVQRGSWPVPPIFPLLQQWGAVDQAEMYRVFNMGIGFVVVCRRRDRAKCLATLHRSGEQAWEIGRIVPGNQDVQFAD